MGGVGARRFEDSWGVPAATSGSGGVPFVPMMQATHLRDRHDAAVRERRDGARHRRVLVEREMRARPFVVGGVAVHQPLQTRLIEHNDVVEALASHESDKPFDIGVLPRECAAVRMLFMPSAFAVSAQPSNA